MTTGLPQLWPVDYHEFPGMLGIFDGWIYLTNEDAPPVRYRRNLKTFEEQSGILPVEMFGGDTPSILVELASGTIIAECGDAASRSHVYRSTDRLATFRKVYSLGVPYAGGAADPSIGWLSRNSFCEYWYNGQAYQLILEYSSIGGLGTEIKLHRSGNDGETWSTLAVWNQTGEQVRHGHCLLADPENLAVYIGFGDGDGLSAVIEWNYNATGNQWTAPINTAHTALDQIAGYAVLVGDERVRPVQIIPRRLGAGRGWDPFIYWATDALSRHGIYKARRGTGFDGTPGARKFYQCSMDRQFPAGFVGWYGVQDDAGAIYVSACREHVGVYTPSDNDAKNLIFATVDGNHFFEIGAMHTNRADGDTKSTAWIIHEGRIYVPNGNHIARRKTGVHVYEPRRNWKGLIPDNLAPVYFVRPGGSRSSNMTTGLGAANPRALAAADPQVVLGAVNGTSITHGARVMVAAGDYATNRAQFQWQNGGAPPGSGFHDAGAGQWVQVSGEGKEITRWDYLGPTSNWLYWNGGNDQKIWIEDITLGCHALENATLVTAEPGTATGCAMKLVDVDLIVSKQQSGVSGLIRLGGEFVFEFENLRILLLPGIGGGVIAHRTDGGTFRGSGLAIIGGTVALDMRRAGAVFDVENFALLNQLTYNCRVSLTPSIRLVDGVMFSEAGNTRTIFDETSGSGYAWTAENLQGIAFAANDMPPSASGTEANFYNAAVVDPGKAAGRHSLISALSDIGLSINATTGEIAVIDSSDVPRGRSGGALRYDMNGRAWGNPRNAGPISADSNDRRGASARRAR